MERFHVCKLYHDYNLNLKSLVQTSATWISCQKKKFVYNCVCEDFVVMKMLAHKTLTCTFCGPILQNYDV